MNSFVSILIHADMSQIAILGRRETDSMSAENEICLFVSLKGNDRWSGTIVEPNEADGHFATIERARHFSMTPELK